MTRNAELPVVLVTEPIASQGIDALNRFATVMHPSRPDEPSILEAARPAEAIVVRVAPITAQVIDAAQNLRLIQKHGVGVDSVDVDHATQRGIPVCITAEANAASVAEFAVAAALTLVKRLHERNVIVRTGRWRDEDDVPVHELAHRTVGIVGGGRVGLRVLQAFVHGLNMRALVYDPYVSAKVICASGGEQTSTIEDLLKRSDIVTLHTPLTKESHHLIDANRLSYLQPHAVLVNTCRGSVVDEIALAAALTNGTLAAAAIDVFEHEPPVESPLLSTPNVMLSPHVAGITMDSAVRTAIHCADEISRVLGGSAPKWCINPKVLEPIP